jgi:phenylacetate-CoA ligase
MLHCRAICKTDRLAGLNGLMVKQAGQSATRTGRGVTMTKDLCGPDAAIHTTSAQSARHVLAREIEGQSRSDIERFQTEQLRHTVQALTGSPFWCRKFAEADFDPTALTAPDDLYGAPTLDKHQYSAALSGSPGDYGGLLTAPLDDIRREGAITYRTTGTSGKQGRFINTAAGFEVFARQGHELMKFAGACPGDSVLITWPLFFWAASWGFYHGGRFGPYLVVPGGPPADSKMRLGLIREYRPAVIVATPSYALTLGQAAREQKMILADHGVRGLLMGGETFGAKKRAAIEELWGIPGGTRNFYGISEGGPLFAVECVYQDGLHLFEGDTIHQFWKPGENGPAQPGEIAEHVFTSISQRTMATWFNFRTRDGARYSDEPCRCGRHTRRMWIVERLDDMVKVKGVNIFASGVEDLLAAIDGVGREFRLVIDTVRSRDVLTLQVEIQPHIDVRVVADQIRQSMQSAWGIQFDVECLAFGTLPRTEAKARRWHDRRNLTA